jgi:glutamate dehydrogenase (NAD(P)+)
LNSREDIANRAYLPSFDPKLVLSFSLPMAQCYFVIDTAISGRSWGGFRVTENLTLAEIEVLARTMTIKTMLAGIPIGGAKGGVSLRAKKYDRDDLMRRVALAIGPYLRQRRYFMGTDLGFTESDADYLYECSGSRLRLFAGRIRVGEACAEGILASLEYLQHNDICGFDERTVALEGFGRIGSATAQLLSSEGFRIVAISNLAGTLYDPRGLNVEELLSIRSGTPEAILSAYSRNHKSVIVLPKEALYSIETEILIPGARTLVIDDEEAEQVKAKIVCPISNAPVTSQGERKLASRGIVSVPDVISNSGGLIASFAQHLGANTVQTKAIISNIIAQNLDHVFAGLTDREVPKRLAVAIAQERFEKMEKAEKIEMLRFLSPWIRTLGSNALLFGFKEYLSLRMGG